MREDLQNARNTIFMLVKDLKIKKKYRQTDEGIGKKAQSINCVVRYLSSSCDIFPPTWVRIYPSFGLTINLCRYKSKDAGASYERMWFLKSICHRIGHPMIGQRFELFFFRLPNGKPAAFSQGSDY